MLSALVFVFVLVIAHACLSMQGMFGRYPHAASAIAALPLLIGPLLLLYLRNILDDAPFTGRDWRHFAPFALALVAWAPYYLQSAEAKLAILQSHTRIPLYIIGFGLVKAVHLGVYLIASYRLVARANRVQPEEKLFRGLRRLTLLLGLGIGIDAVIFVLENIFAGFPVSSDTFGALVMIGFVYGLAHLAMRMPLDYQPAPLSEPEPAKPSYAASQLTPDDSARYLRDLSACMENEHAYRDGELSLEALASRIGMSAHELSQLVNQSCGMNFQEYLNGFRVRDLKTAMRDPLQSGASILELGLAAGFNSKSSLNRAFKKHVGMTPSEFRGGENSE
ncbi:helix-turn-helix domain-containing protein [Massilia glaciei]|uniref:helix-turn-helix domain-containing protein n=1 Tax=Massilia glaciei TaxID=1524097 RepID=UPI0015E80126|nr:helix-turn-helix transcriptional regulator [Massilia glaciei]